jgi:outer membrane protein
MNIIKIMTIRIQKTNRKSKPSLGYSLLLAFVLILLAPILGNSTHVLGQEVWNLSKCVDYALENNIDLNQTALDVQTQKINFVESAAGLLPDVNASSSSQFGFGRSVDADYNVTFDKTLYNPYSISSSIDIFHGLIKINNIFYNRYLHLASKETYQIAKNQLIINVLSAFYTVAYSNGLENVALEQVEVAARQVERTQRMVDLGKESPVVVQELKSQWAADKLSLAKAESDLINAVTNLKQLLRIEESQLLLTDTSEFDIIIKNSIPNSDSVFNQAVDYLPQIKRQEYLLSAADKNLAMAKGNISPRIYLSAGIGSYYYYSSGSTETISFKNQLENNQSQYIQIGINIPIFNQLSTYSNIKRRQIAVNDQQLAIEKTMEELLAQIVRTRQELESAEKEFLSSQEMMVYSEISFKQMEKKLENGLANPTEYATAKQQYTSAKANLLRSKLLYVMYSQMLDFYVNGNWDHLK